MKTLVALGMVAVVLIVFAIVSLVHTSEREVNATDTFMSRVAQ